MKKLIVGFCLMAILTPFAHGQLPYAQNFNTMDYDGQSVFSNGTYSTWTGNGVAIITNIDYFALLNTTYMGTPLSGGYSNVLAFSEAPLTNTYATSDTIVSMDMMVQPSFMQDLTVDSAISNGHCGVTFTTNGQLAVYHAYYNPGSEGNCPTYDGLRWSIFNNVPVVTSGKWVRITINMNFAAANSDFISNPSMVQIMVDGIAASNADGYAIADVAQSQRGGTWFQSIWAGSGDGLLHRMVLNGSGMMDELNVMAALAPHPASAHGIPSHWFELMGVTNDLSDTSIASADTADTDGDGMQNWAEYVAGTHPTNGQSRLAIVSQTLSGGVPRLRWLSSSGALAPYRVDASTNLVAGAGWVNVTNSIVYDASGTNDCIMPVPTANPTFYRVDVIQP